MCSGIDKQMPYPTNNLNSRFSAKKDTKTLKIDKITELSTAAMEKNVSIMRRIRAWKERQIIHMPALLESDLWEPFPNIEDGYVVHCWDIKLQFPSSFQADI